MYTIDVTISVVDHVIAVTAPPVCARVPFFRENSVFTFRNIIFVIIHHLIIAASAPALHLKESAQLSFFEQVTKQSPFHKMARRRGAVSALAALLTAQVARVGATTVSDAATWPLPSCAVRRTSDEDLS